MRKNLEKFSITQRLRITLANEYPNFMSISRVASITGLTCIQVQSNLKSMRRMGFVERGEDKKYKITPKGLSLARIETTEGLRIKTRLNVIERKIATLQRNYLNSFQTLIGEYDVLEEKLGEVEQEASFLYGVCDNIPDSHGIKNPWDISYNTKTTNWEGV